MTRSTPKLIPVPDDGAWDQLNDESPQGSVFTSSAFLSAVCPEAEKWFLVDNGRVVGGVPVLVRDAVPAPAPYLYTPYHGLLLTTEISAQPIHRSVPRIVELSTAVLTALAERYPTFSLGLHPALSDLRGFQWFNYGEPHKPRATISVRYTGVIDLALHGALEGYLARVRSVRRYEYSRATRAGLRVLESQDPSILTELLQDTFSRQGLEVDAGEQGAIERICAAFLGTQRARLTIAETSDGAVIGATLFLEHAGTFYYLLGATRTEARNAGANTVLFVDAVRCALERGLRRIDTVGINSPNRGDFKTSLDAAPVPYFIVSVG
jgi:hypothetical protein